MRSACFFSPEHETLDKEELALCFVTVNPDGTYSAILDSDTIYRNIEKTFGITVFAEMKSAISDYMRLSAQAGLYGGDGSNIVEVAVSQLGKYRRGGLFKLVRLQPLGKLVRLLCFLVR